jgi:hypothetical protein
MSDELRAGLIKKFKDAGAQILYDRFCTICGSESIGTVYIEQGPFSAEEVKRGQLAVDTLPGFVCPKCSRERHMLWGRQAEQVAEGRH